VSLEAGTSALELSLASYEIYMLIMLVVLFADTLDLLIPGVGVVEWKILCGLLM
jgi:hypothetical protein